MKKLHFFSKHKQTNYFHNFKSIHTAMLFSFSMIIIAALMIFLLISLNYTRKAIIQNSTGYTSQLVKQVNADIDSYIQYMRNISMMLTTNTDVSEYLFTAHADPAEEQMHHDAIIEQFHTLCLARPDICNIGIYRSNERYIFNYNNSKINENINFSLLDWYQKTLQSQGATYLSSSHVQNIVDNSYNWVITLSSTLKNPHTSAREGILFIDLNYSSIRNLCENINLGKKGYVFILDKNGDIVYHPKQQLIYSNLETECIDEIQQLNENNNSFIDSDSDGKKLYTASTSKQTGWTIVGVAYLQELNLNEKQTQILYILTALFLFFNAMIISNFLSKAITQPIRTLQNSMNKVEKGDFEQALVPETAKNEIGALSNSFNLMTLQIQSLIAQNIEEQRLKRKSELKALQSQIKPHFLYNTLDSIIWMAEAEANKDVVLMTSSLAKLLRQSISNDNELVPIRGEIEYTKSYLTIQQMRYKDTLDFKINVDNEILDYTIVKLTLQPLVENAIYHGIKFKEHMGTVRIGGSIMGEDIIITISDNGIGMNSEQLKHIFDNKHKSSSSGVGINNIQERLQLYYGERYGLIFESYENNGTTVYVRIPANNTETFNLYTKEENNNE